MSFLNFIIGRSPLIILVLAAAGVMILFLLLRDVRKRVTGREHNIFQWWYPLAGAYSILMISLSFLVLLSFPGRSFHVRDDSPGATCMKAACPKEMTRDYMFFGKSFHIRQQAEIWHPSPATLQDLGVILMVPSTRLEYRNLCRLAKEMACSGYVVAVFKHKIRSFWAPLIPGIRQPDPNHRILLEEDIMDIMGFIRDLNYRESELADRLSLEQTGIVTRFGFYDAPDIGIVQKKRSVPGKGIFLAVLSEDALGKFSTSRIEYLSGEPEHVNRETESEPVTFFRKLVSLIVNRLDTEDFYPVRMINGVSHFFHELNPGNYLNMQAELVTYFETNIII